MVVYNLEYRILDKIGRTKKTLHGGVYQTESTLNEGKQSILNCNKDTKIEFDVYIIDHGPFTR